ncbi:MAG: hypothetical protein HZB46_08635 [Solirubrobacterales bacterium]|nr:hypothetical protein [Solirubrobacterales bacterium]
MATFAPNPDTDVQLAELDDRVKRAWAAYKEQLSPLQGAEYATAEERCWDELQATLREIESDRAELAVGTR